MRHVPVRNLFTKHTVRWRVVACCMRLPVQLLPHPATTPTLQTSSACADPIQALNSFLRPPPATASSSSQPLVSDHRHSVFFVRFRNPRAHVFPLPPLQSLVPRTLPPQQLLGLYFCCLSLFTAAAHPAAVAAKFVRLLSVRSFVWRAGVPERASEG